MLSVVKVLEISAEFIGGKSSSAEDLPSKIANHLAIARPDLNLAILERQDLLLIVQKNESFWRVKPLNSNFFVRLRIVNQQVFLAGFYHDFFIELLQELDLT